MTEKADQTGSIFERLTEEEQRILNKALKKVEAEVFQNVVRKLGAWVSVVMSLLFIGGCLYMNSWSSNVENSAVQKLVDDPALQEKIIQRLEEKEKDDARAASIIISDLEQIQSMIRKISENFPSRLPSNPSNQTNKRGNEKR